MTRLMVLIYDFDRATCPSLGENLYVTQPLTLARGQPTIYRELQPFEPNRDLAILCKWLKEAKQWRASSMDDFVVLQLQDDVPWYQAYGSEIETSLLDSIDIVKILIQKAPWQPGAHTYDLSDYRFNPDGSLNTGYARFAQVQQALIKSQTLANTSLIGVRNCEQFTARVQAELQACQDQLIASNGEVERLRSFIAVLQKPHLEDMSGSEDSD
jgi:hypothetical protein